MIASCANASNYELREKRLKKTGFKLCSSVSSDSGTDAKAGNPPRQKGINDSLYLDVHQGNHFRPAAESIHHGE